MVLEQLSSLSIPALRGNPFDSRPIEGNRVPEIVGRDELLSSIRELILSGSPRMILLSGERGSGRTSFINALCSFTSNNMVCQYWPEENQLLSVIHEISISFDGFETSESIHKISDGLVKNLESRNGPLPIIALDYPSNVEMKDFIPRITPILQRLRALVIIALTPSQLNSLDDDSINLFSPPLYLNPLCILDIQKLVDKRIRKMARERWLINNKILSLIHEKTGGNPRSIIKILQNLVDEHRGIGSYGTLDSLQAHSVVEIPNIEIVNQEIPKKSEKTDIVETSANTSIQGKPKINDTTSYQKSIFDEKFNLLDTPTLEEHNSEIIETPKPRNDDFTTINWDNESKLTTFDSLGNDDLEINSIIVDKIEIPNKEIMDDTSNSLSLQNNKSTKETNFSNFGGIIGRSRKTTNYMENTVNDDDKTVYIDASTKADIFEPHIDDRSNSFSNKKSIISDVLEDINEEIVDRTDGELWTVDPNEYGTLPSEPIYEEPIYEEPIYEEPIYEELKIKHIRTPIKIPVGPKWDIDNPFDMNFASELSDAESIIISKAKVREISPSDNELQALLQVGRPRLSQLYNGLNKAGILSVRKKGRSRLFKLTDSAVKYF